MKAAPRNLLGPVIRQVRYRLGLTQPMLVARLNVDGWDVSRGTWAKIEAQVRWLADFEVVRVARALGVPVAELYTLAGAEEPQRRRSTAGASGGSRPRRRGAPGGARGPGP